MQELESTVLMFNSYGIDPNASALLLVSPSVFVVESLSLIDKIPNCLHS